MSICSVRLLFSYLCFRTSSVFVRLLFIRICFAYVFVNSYVLIFSYVKRLGINFLYTVVLGLVHRCGPRHECRLLYAFERLAAGIQTLLTPIRGGGCRTRGADGRRLCGGPVAAVGQRMKLLRPAGNAFNAWGDCRACACVDPSYCPDVSLGSPTRPLAARRSRYPAP